MTNHPNRTTIKRVQFTSRWDLVLDWQGITHQPSGTAPHNPAQARIVFQNCETTTRLSAALNALAIEAADAGQIALLKFARSHFRPISRNDRAGQTMYDAAGIESE